MIGDDAKVTFVVHGPLSTDAGYVYKATHGGDTTIDIYDKQYNRIPCIKTYQAWQAGNLAEMQRQADLCMDVKLEPAVKGAGTMVSGGAIYNHIMSDCYSYILTPPLGGVLPKDDDLWAQCLNRYLGLFGSGTVTSGVLTSVDGICGSGQGHSRSTTGNGSGYLGQCISMTGTQSNSCQGNQITDYCNQIKKPSLTDQSSLPNLSGVKAYLPAFVLDAGISNLGNIAGSFKGRVLVDTPPTGVIQEFSDRLHFGTMVFNFYGASSAECSAGGMDCPAFCSNNRDQSCTTNWECSSRVCTVGSDGGRIVNYINDPASPLGDHSSGLIAAIDNLEPWTWTPFAESLYNAIGYFAARSDLRLQTTDFDLMKPPAPPTFTCQRNNVLIVTDGMSTADRNAKVEALATLYRDPIKAATGKSETGSDTLNSCPVFAGSRSLDDIAWIAAHRDIKTFSTASSPSTDLPATPSRSIATHVIFTGLSNGAPGQCDPAVLMKDTAASGGGNFETASDPGTLYGKFADMLRKIADGNISGTGSSLISTGEGNGAVYLQERFYPVATFDAGATRASWIGEMDGLWYYIDPFLGSRAGAGSTLREDGDLNGKLTLAQDRMVSFRYDAVANRTSAYLSADANGDGAGEGTEVGPVEIENLNVLWRGGRQLWSRDVKSSPRTIFTPAINSETAWNSSGLMKFSSEAANAAALAPYLNLQQGDPGAAKLIDYLHGIDYPGDTTMRSRRLTIAPTPPATDDELKSGVGVWKLGDIISSTPKVQSAVPLANYHLPPPKGYGDDEHHAGSGSYETFVGSTAYKERGMVYVGANDGMLHAFRFGKLDIPVAGEEKAVLTGTDLGREVWAFIPRNALPYLKYLASPRYDHLYLVDGSLALADVDTGSGESRWRTVLIGGMGLGGATANSCSPGSNWVQTPAGDSGYSSYFALDVTDPANPSLLWEFSDPALGYATSGAAIVRAGGKWYAVFGSGPTGPVDEKGCSFKGYSDQKLQLFVVDLKASGPWAQGSNYWVLDSGIDKAFAGSISGGGIDADAKKSMNESQDDAVHLGYVRSDGSGAWTQGGVLRLILKDGPTPSGNEDASKNWTVSKVIDGTGPVTSGIARLIDRRNGKLWLYFGTGRYFHVSDDLESPRHLFGVQDRCYAKSTSSSGNFIDKNCDLNATAGAEPDATGKGKVLGLGDLKMVDPESATTDMSGNYKGWYIPLDAAGALGAERSITDPLALTSGQVIFGTFQPSKVPCLPDTSYLWRVRYDCGDAVPEGAVRGKILTQLSSGATGEGDLSAGFTAKKKRRGDAMTGRPGGLKAVSNSALKPMRKIIHIQER